MNEITAHAPNFECAGESVWLAVLALLCHLILKDHNDVHGKASYN
jgi:hypothetical protein